MPKIYSTITARAGKVNPNLKKSCVQPLFAPEPKLAGKSPSQQPTDQASDQKADGIQFQKTENVHIKIEIEIGKPENPTRLRLLEDHNGVCPKPINAGVNNPQKSTAKQKIGAFPNWRKKSRRRLGRT